MEEAILNGIDINLLEEQIEENETEEIKGEINLEVDADTKVIFKKSELEMVLKLLSTTIDMNSPRVVSRGLNFFFNEDVLRIVNANELIHFESTINPILIEGTGEKFYVSYELVNKIMKYVPEQVLIYKRQDTWFIRLYTGDLNLINSQLLESDLRRLTLEYKVLDELMEINVEDIKRLEGLSKLYTFQSDLPRRVFDVCEEGTLFITPTLYAKTNINLPKVKLYPKVINFLIESSKVLEDGSLKIFKTDSDPILRYALVLEVQGLKVQIVTNFVDSSLEESVNAVLDVPKNKTEIDFRGLKYNLEYITTLSSVNYFRGTVSLNTVNNGIVANVALNNGDDTKVDIPVKGELGLNLNDVRVNALVLLTALNSLNENLNTYMYYSNSYLYIFNEELTLAIVTY